MTTALENLAAAKAALAVAETAAASEVAAQKAIVIDEIIEAMKDDNISLAELSVRMRVGSSKYSSGTDTWSGKGKKPAWIEKHVAGGGKLEHVLTNKPKAAE